MATHFAVVLGAWRLRVRIDIDEPRDEREHGEESIAATPVQSTQRPATVRVHGRG